MLSLRPVSRAMLVGGVLCSIASFSLAAETAESADEESRNLEHLETLIEAHRDEALRRQRLGAAFGRAADPEIDRYQRLQLRGRLKLLERRVRTGRESAAHLGARLESMADLLDGAEWPSIPLSDTRNARGSAGTFIRGRVVDGATQQPLPDVVVEFFDERGYSAGVAVTNVSGFYETPPILTPGQYHARTYNESHYIDRVHGGDRCAPTCDLSSGTWIEVGQDPVKRIRIELDKGAVVEGNVRDAATGAGISGVIVDFFFEPDMYWQGAYFGSATTRGDGGYRFLRGLPSGNYRVRTRNGLGYVDELYDDVVCYGSCTEAEPVALEEGTSSVLDFQLDRGGSISGRVVDADTSAPVLEAEITVVDTNGEFVTAVESGSDGTYLTTNGLAPGNYHAAALYWPYYGDFYFSEVYRELRCSSSCTPTDGEPIAVTAGAGTGGIDFSLDRGGLVTGRVVARDTGEPVQLGHVEFDGFGYSQPNEDGYYRSELLEPGPYRVTYSVGEPYVAAVWEDLVCPNEYCDEPPGNPVVVEAGEVNAGIDFALEKLGVLSGQVTELGTGAPIDARVRVKASSGYGNRTLFTDASGSYQDMFYPGDYTISTSSNYLDQVWEDITCAIDCDHSLGTPVSVSVGSTTDGIDFELSRSGSIEGSVTLQTGGPANIWLDLWNADGWLRSFGADRDGRFTTEGSDLPAGEYFLNTDSYVYLNELWANLPCEPGCTPQTGTPIVVADGVATTGIDFVLDQGPQFSGRVSTEDGGSISAGGVHLGLAGTESPSYSFYFAPDGSYSTQGWKILPGDYWLRTDTPWLDELWEGIPCEGECDLLPATLVSAPANALVSGLDFSLAASGPLEISVVDSATGSNLYVLLRILDAQGEEVKTLTHSYATIVVRDLEPGWYYMHTRPFWDQAYVHQVWGGPECLPECDVSAGTPILVEVGSPVQIEFRLRPAVFYDDFENGVLWRWSEVVGGN